MFNIFKSNKNLKYLNRIKEDFEDKGHGPFPNEIYSLVKNQFTKYNQSLENLLNQKNITLEIITHKLLIEIAFDVMDGVKTHLYRGVLTTYGKQISQVFYDSVKYLKDIGYYDDEIEQQAKEAFREKVSTIG